MNNLRYCEGYENENLPAYIVEYRGDFEDQIRKVNYACGDIITDTLATVAVSADKIDQLRKDVPSIIFIEFRNVFILQDISPSTVDKIQEIKINPYLNLTGRGILVGMIDSGIDYLNEEFIREDGTSRIISIWDQSVPYKGEANVYIGATYSNEDINKAITASKSGGNPYDIVPSKDEENHGTKMASIIGARGYNKEVEGIAPNCDFVVVKLSPSPNYKKMLLNNGLPIVPVYNNTEVIAGIEYLKNMALSLRRPMVIFLGVGGTEGSHDGNNITSRYLTSIAGLRGIVLVSGTGNEGASEGHAYNEIKSPGAIDTVELVIPREIRAFSFSIWIQRPNVMSLTVIDPSGESSNFFYPKIYSTEEKRFLIINTRLTVESQNPESFTGNQLFILRFEDIKPGVWKIQLRGDYIVDGRYDIWLPPKITIPDGTRFLRPSQYTTLTIPSTARKVVTVAYYDSSNDSLVAASGRGFNSNHLINPDIATAGINILTTSNTGKITTSSGSSAATAITAGVCALLLQWGIVDGNDPTMYSTKIRSYLIYGANRTGIYDYPNRETGYGRLDIYNLFLVLGGNYRMIKSEEKLDDDLEYYVGNLFIRIPKKLSFKQQFQIRE